MRNDLCIECHFPLPNTEHVTWISKKVSSISSKLSKLGSHKLVTKVENLVTKQKMLLANSNRVGEKEDVLLQEQSKLSVILWPTWIFLAQSKKLGCFRDWLYWSQFLALPINMSVYVKIWNQRGNCTLKHHTEGLY